MDGFPGFLGFLGFLDFLGFLVCLGFLGQDLGNRTEEWNTKETIVDRAFFI